MLQSSWCRVVLAILGVVLMGVSSVQAQTIDCDAPAPTTPGEIRTGQPYTVQFCVPSVVTTPEGDVAVRIDGFTGQVDTAAPFEMGKLPLGAPSPTQKLSAVSYRTTTGVQKGAHTFTVTPWNCPMDPATGSPMTTCTETQKQKASPVAIPFVATDVVLTGAPPPIQKGRVSR